MTLDEFVAATKGRLPTAGELSEVCEAIGIGFGQDAEGRPVLRVNAENRAEGLLLAKLLRREPWRSQVIASRLVPAGPTELLWPTGLIGGLLAEGGRWDEGAGWWRPKGQTKWRRIPGREHLTMLNGLPAPEEA